jgi:hypothetical protein
MPAENRFEFSSALLKREAKLNNAENKNVLSTSHYKHTS